MSLWRIYYQAHRGKLWRGWEGGWVTRSGARLFTDDEATEMWRVLTQEIGFREDSIGKEEALGESTSTRT